MVHSDLQEPETILFLGAMEQQRTKEGTIRMKQGSDQRGSHKSHKGVRTLQKAI